MDRIVFDEWKIKEAENEIRKIQSELGDILKEMLSVKAELNSMSPEFRKEEAWYIWRSRYDSVLKAIDAACFSLTSIAEIYKNTEQKNKKLVASLPKWGREKRPEKGTYNKGISTGRLLEGGILRHEPWVQRAAESILYEAGDI